MAGEQTYPNWVKGKPYAVGDIVRFTDGKNYVCVNANDGLDPVVSNWYWDEYTATSGQTGTTPAATSVSQSGASSNFVVTEAQFNQMLPNRNAFYTYAGLTTAAKAYPAFCTTGDDTVKKQEAAAFLANVNQESGGLMYVTELNTANYSHYCDASQPYGCPAGQAMYYGRGPLQLSWNYNYKAAGDALGIDLLNDPDLVETDAAVSWKTALWFWMTSTGAGKMTCHDAIVNGHGFGETIRTINGALECGPNRVADAAVKVQRRVDAYESYTAILGVSAGDKTKLTC